VHLSDRANFKALHLPPAGVAVPGQLTHPTIIFEPRAACLKKTPNDLTHPLRLQGLGFWIDPPLSENLRS
jgi:hypothetical protein